MPRKSALAVMLAALLVPVLAASAVTKAKDKNAVKEAPVRSDVVRQFQVESALADNIVASITVVAPSSEERAANSTISQVLARIQTLYGAISAEGGIQSRINSLAKGQSIELTQDVFDMIAKSVELADQTGGWFDITAPSPKSWFIEKDWRRIALNKEARTLAFKSDGMKIDLSKIACGYMVDLATDAIQGAGFENALVSVGPVSRNIGHDIFTPWNIQVGFGDTGDKLARRAMIYNFSNVASANVTSKGLGLGLIDPRNKKEVSGKLIQSLTILAADASTATAYALAAYTLGPKVGIRYVEAHPEIKGVIVDEGGNLVASAGLSGPNLHTPIVDQEPLTPVTEGPGDLRQKEREEERDAQKTQ